MVVSRYPTVSYGRIYVSFDGLLTQALVSRSLGELELVVVGVVMGAAR